MNIVYNSDLYVLVAHPGRGIEIVDIHKRRVGLLLLGTGAEEFEVKIKKFIKSAHPNFEQMDEFIEGYSGLCIHPVTLN